MEGDPHGRCVGIVYLKHKENSNKKVNILHTILLVLKVFKLVCFFHFLIHLFVILSESCNINIKTLCFFMTLHTCIIILVVEYKSLGCLDIALKYFF